MEDHSTAKDGPNVAEIVGTMGTRGLSDLGDIFDDQRERWISLNRIGRQASSLDTVSPEHDFDAWEV